MRNAVLLVLATTLLLPMAWAQDTSDPLFTNPEPDSPADTTQKVPLDAYTGQSMKFFETLDVDGYVVSGYKSDGDLVNSPYNALKFGFGSDMRLDRTARAYASFSIAYPNPKSTADTTLYNPYDPPVTLTDAGDLSFTNMTIKELFLDYSLGNFAIIRLGRQSATWGQGRLFNPGNLVNGIGDGVAAKVSTVIGPFSLTGVAIKNDNLYLGTSPDVKSAFALGSIAEALLLEYSSDWFSSGLSGFYHASVGSKADLYFKSSFLGADLFLDGLVEVGTTYQQSYSGVAGLYRDFGEKTKWLKLQAEWLVSGQGDSGSFTKVSDKNLGFNDQTLGLAATTELLSFISTKPSVLWLHSLVDASGQLVLGLVNTSLPHINLTLALARIYGDPGSRYIVSNPDSQLRVWSLTLKASFNFDIKS
jgi:hypothetical protein